MRHLRFAAVVLAAVFLSAALVVAAPDSVSAQMAEDAYVSCIKCHALPEQQALGQMAGHGIGYPPSPEQACTQCHDTAFHEQNPSVPPPPQQRYFLRQTFGTGTYLTNHCTTCHPGGHPHELTPEPAIEGMPYFDGTPNAVLAVPTSVLPLFDPLGQANQDPYVGGMVCSTCHDPHEPAYPAGASFRPMFLRAGSPASTLPLCNACHDPAPPAGAAAYLVIPNRTSAVTFATGPNGQQQIVVTVKNRGNATSYNENATVGWIDANGAPGYVGSFPIPPLYPEEERSFPVFWTPPPHWSAGEGHYEIDLPPSALRPDRINVYVRAMYLPPAPTNLRVNYVGASEVNLVWDPPQAGSLFFDVYRDGLLLGRAYGPYYTVNGLAPQTPHVYTVKSVTPDEISSEPSAAVGATTTAALVVRVPQDFQTIQEAIWYAQPGTSIHVAAGTYTESFSFYGKEGITVRGQDAAGCVLDLPYNGHLDLGQTPPPPYSYGSAGNTLAGFTIRGDVQIRLGAGDVLANCVVGSNSGARVAAAGGLAANCIFDGWGPAVEIANGGFFAAVNSVFLGYQPLYHLGPPATSALLLNNDFVSWFPYEEYQGSGNFSAYPAFQTPGPPSTYFTLPYSPTTDAGFWLGAPYSQGTTDVGVFEAGFLYTPQPPFNLSATVQGAPAVNLAWMASPDFPLGVTNYQIYRATDPSFPPGSEAAPYATIPAGGMTAFADHAVTPGVTYYYQVRASNGPALPPWQGELLSTPTNTASAQVTLNRPPAPAPDAAQTPEDQAATISVLANDTDPDGDPLFLVSVDSPQYGTTSVNPDGTVRYVPAADYSGPDQFLYTVTDGRGEFVNALVAVDVTPVNDPPVAAADVYATVEDAPLFVPPPGLLFNDSDPDGDPLFTVPVTFPTRGSLMIHPDGSFQYFPDPDFNGTDSFTYAAASLLWVSNPATVTIHVTPVNDMPAADPQPVWTAEDVAVPIILTGADADGDPLTFAVAAAPAHGTLTGTAPNLTYTPSPNYYGPDTFSFTASDGQLTSVPGFVSINVTPVNDAPVAVDQGWATLEDQPRAITLQATDVEGDALTYAIATPPAHGTLAGAAPNLTYTPAANYNGPDGFTFTASDQLVASAAATVTFIVSAVNDPPVAVGDDYTAVEDTPLDVPAPGLLGNDTDVDGPSLAPVLTTGPAHGMVTLNPDRSFRYRAYANYSGPDSFVYHANDGLISSNDVTVTITVTPAPDAPVASPQSKSTDEDTPIALVLSATDADGDALTYAVAQAPMHGTLSGTAPNLTYTPALNFHGSDSFTFTATDGQLTSAPATVSISVAAVNDPPVANSVNETTREDESWGLAFTATDVDQYTVLTYAVVQGPAHGTLTGTMPVIRYVPAPDFFGTDSVTFTASDGQAVSNVATITITVTPVNDRPVANAQPVTTPEDAPRAVVLSGSDAEGASLTYAIGTAPAHGTLSGTAPNLTYTPGPNYYGPDSFTFRVNDGALDSASATVTITVTPVNDAPLANAGPDQSGVTPQVLAFDGEGSSDLDGWIVDYSWNWGDGTPASAGPGSGATHAYAAAGTYTVTLTVTDNSGATATDTATVTVTAANLALNKTATASSSRSGYLPANAVDGSTATSWMSNKTGGTQWLTVDLGGCTTISNVKVLWQSGYHARSFKVETSTNGSTWTTREATTGGTGGTTNVTFAPANARYVKVSSTKAYGQHYGILELEVYR